MRFLSSPLLNKFDYHQACTTRWVIWEENSSKCVFTFQFLYVFSVYSFFFFFFFFCCTRWASYSLLKESTGYAIVAYVHSFILEFPNMIFDISILVTHGEYVYWKCALQSEVALSPRLWRPISTGRTNIPWLSLNIISLIPILSTYWMMILVYSNCILNNSFF